MCEFCEVLKFVYIVAEDLVAEDWRSSLKLLLAADLLCSL